MLLIINKLLRLRVRLCLCRNCEPGLKAALHVQRKRKHKRKSVHTCDTHIKHKVTYAGAVQIFIGHLENRFPLTRRNYASINASTRKRKYFLFFCLHLCLRLCLCRPGLHVRVLCLFFRRTCKPALKSTEKSHTRQAILEDVHFKSWER